jgi:hypothetical protein
LAKIALWKKQVQPVFALFTFLKILVQPDTQPDTQPVFVWWKQVQPVLKQVQPVSALFPFVTASLPVSPVRKSRVQIFGKPVQSNFESGSTEFETG